MLIFDVGIGGSEFSILSTFDISMLGASIFHNLNCDPKSDRLLFRYSFFQNIQFDFID
jgi:hypothetical protein